MTEDKPKGKSVNINLKASSDSANALARLAIRGGYKRSPECRGKPWTDLQWANAVAAGAKLAAQLVTEQFPRGPLGPDEDL